MLTQANYRRDMSFDSYSTAVIMIVLRQDRVSMMHAHTPALIHILLVFEAYYF